MSTIHSYSTIKNKPNTISTLYQHYNRCQHSQLVVFGVLDEVHIPVGAAADVTHQIVELVRLHHGGRRVQGPRIAPAMPPTCHQQWHNMPLTMKQYTINMVTIYHQYTINMPAKKLFWTEFYIEFCFIGNRTRVNMS